MSCVWTPKGRSMLRLESPRITLNLSIPFWKSLKGEIKYWIGDNKKVKSLLNVSRKLLVSTRRASDYKISFDQCSCAQKVLLGPRRVFYDSSHPAIKYSTSHISSNDSKESRVSFRFLSVRKIRCSSLKSCLNFALPWLQIRIIQSRRFALTKARYSVTTLPSHPICN